MLEISNDEAFFFPPFHPNCRCTVVAVDLDKEDLPVNVQDYATESSTSYYDVDDNYQIIPRRNVVSVEQIESGEDAQIYFRRNHGIDFDFGDFSPTNWQDFASEYDGCLKDLYDLVGKECFASLKKVCFKDPEEVLLKAIGWTLESGSRICMNKNYLPFDRLSEVVADNVSLGVFNRLALGNISHYVFGHELGHVAYASLREEQRDRLAVLFHSRLNRDNPISRVATQNPNEFFAEYLSLFSLPKSREILNDYPEFALIFSKIMSILGK